MSWQSHPIAVAAVTCVGTIAACYNVLIPAYTTSLENKVAKDLSVISSLQESERKISERAVKLDLLNKKILSEQTFSRCNPYPRGFDSVLVGDLASKLAEVYGSESLSIDDDNGWITLNYNNDPIFDRVTYYLDRGKTRITQILFFYKDRPLTTDPNYDPKKESATQLAVIKHLRSELPSIEISHDKETAKPVYLAFINGKPIYKIDEGSLLLTNYVMTFDKQKCENK